jgi:hypothetical protein
MRDGRVRAAEQRIGFRTRLVDRLRRLIQGAAQLDQWHGEQPYQHDERTGGNQRGDLTCRHVPS